jgi:hypothetical protein
VGKLIITILLLLVMGCSNNKQAIEMIRVADLTKGPVVFSEIQDMKKINKINEIAEQLEWADKPIETNGDPDYSFWLERKGVELRVTNYDIWLNEDKSSVIIDHVKFKYASINGVDLEELRNLLEADVLTYPQQ